VGKSLLSRMRILPQDSAMSPYPTPEAYDTVTYELELLEYPLAELGKFFAQSQESKLNEKDAMIFHFFIRHRISNLIRIAKEIDEENGKEL
jgi:hypothetical protein